MRGQEGGEGGEGSEGDIVAGPRRPKTIYPNIFTPLEGKGKGCESGESGERWWIRTQVRSSHSSHSSHSSSAIFWGIYTVFIE